MYDPFQVKLIHLEPLMLNQRKWPMNNNESWDEKVVQKIPPLEPVHSGRSTVVTVSFKFHGNI